MLTPQDVRAAQFEKNIRGYRTEEVDRFLDKVEEQLKQDEDQMCIRDRFHLLPRGHQGGG